MVCFEPLAHSRHAVVRAWCARHRPDLRGTHVNSGCCFDYGNSETTRKADAGAMDAISFSKQGAIILGSGGDCCKPDGGANLSAGTCYEGAIVAGYPSDATENAVQADIIAAGYR